MFFLESLHGFKRPSWDLCIRPEVSQTGDFSRRASYESSETQNRAEAIGFTVLAGAFAVGPVSGCALNPAAAVPPSINITAFESLKV